MVFSDIELPSPSVARVAGLQIVVTGKVPVTLAVLESSSTTTRGIQEPGFNVGASGSFTSTTVAPTLSRTVSGTTTVVGLFHVCLNKILEPTP